MEESRNRHGAVRQRVQARRGGESFFETFCGLASEGRCDARGQPPLLQVAASSPLWGMVVAGPPIAAQRLLMGLLRPLARARGYRARYPRFEFR